VNLQGTEQWYLDRCGRATASEFSAVLAKGQGKTRASYMRRVVAERLTGKPTETYSNGHMARGTAQEPLARLAYEAATGNPVELVGFIQHPEIMAGCSPDGILGSDGGGEFKCVIPTTQLDTIEGGDYPSEHRAQVQGNLWITGRKWWDFCSYSPDLPAHLQIYIFRVQRDEQYIAILEAEVRKFLQEVDARCERLMRMSMSLEESLKASLRAA
jgi:hypothetical protein